jgi:aspartate aminotransferase-like enzyme
MLDEEGLPNVFARHDRHGAATRAARLMLNRRKISVRNASAL